MHTNRTVLGLCDHVALIGEMANAATERERANAFASSNVDTAGGRDGLILLRDGLDIVRGRRKNAGRRHGRNAGRRAHDHDRLTTVFALTVIRPCAQLLYSPNKLFARSVFSVQPAVFLCDAKQTSRLLSAGLEHP